MDQISDAISRPAQDMFDDVSVRAHADSADSFLLHDLSSLTGAACLLGCCQHRRTCWQSWRIWRSQSCNRPCCRRLPRQWRLLQGPRHRPLPPPRCPACQRRPKRASPSKERPTTRSSGRCATWRRRWRCNRSGPPRFCGGAPQCLHIWFSNNRVAEYQPLFVPPVSVLLPSRVEQLDCTYINLLFTNPKQPKQQY